MKLLLTSQSIHNNSIANALRELVGKPTNEATIVCIPTSYNAAVGDKSWFISNINDAYNVGWKSFEIIDIAAMNTLPDEMWLSRIEAADVIFMGGGGSYYINYWLEKTGLMDKLPKLLESKVYVGSSAGSMVATKSVKFSSEALKHFNDVNPSELGLYGQSSSKTLGLVDFDLRLHLNHPGYEYLTEELLKKASKRYHTDVYVLDDDSAVKVDGGRVKVVGKGQWYLIKDGVITQDARKTA